MLCVMKGGGWLVTYASDPVPRSGHGLPDWQLTAPFLLSIRGLGVFHFQNLELGLWDEVRTFIYPKPSQA